MVPQKGRSSRSPSQALRSQWSPMMLLGAAFAVSLYSPQELQSVWLCGQATPSVRSAQEYSDSSKLTVRAKAVGGPKRKDTKKQVAVQKERKKREDVIELEGTVVVHSRNIFKVLLSNGAEACSSSE
eukprot:symbB.v1.2.024096.t1/scaffold2255.1/size84268/9